MKLNIIQWPVVAPSCRYFNTVSRQCLYILINRKYLTKRYVYTSLMKCLAKNAEWNDIWHQSNIIFVNIIWKWHYKFSSGKFVSFEGLSTSVGPIPLVIMGIMCQLPTWKINLYYYTKQIRYRHFRCQR